MQLKTPFHPYERVTFHLSSALAPARSRLDRPLHFGGSLCLRFPGCGPGFLSPSRGSLRVPLFVHP